MNTNDLKQLIGKPCLAIDPRSKKQEWKPGKIISAHYSISTNKHTGDIHERISYEVELKKRATTKDKWGVLVEYHRTFVVSGDRIQIPSQE